MFGALIPLGIGTFLGNLAAKEQERQEAQNVEVAGVKVNKYLLWGGAAVGVYFAAKHFKVIK